jgi:hypothetical protein
VIGSELARMGFLASDADESSCQYQDLLFTGYSGPDVERDGLNGRTSFSEPPSRYPSPGTSRVNVQLNF